MKRFMILLAMMGALATSVHAEENWQYVTDGSDGSRILIDAKSVSISEYNKQKDLTGHFITATVRFVNSPEIPADSRFFISIDHDECFDSQNGHMVVIELGNPKVRPFSYFWASTAGKVYDNVGNWMCQASKIIEGTVDSDGNPTNAESKYRDFHKKSIPDPNDRPRHLHPL